MTEQQMRFNEGKPKHSYFFASATALEKLRDALGTTISGSGEGYYAEAMSNIGKFLDGSDEALPEAARAIVQGLQADANGDECDDLWLTVEEFLARSPAALDAYSGVCVYGEGKYARGNFRKGAPITQYLDSALRHILGRLRGELLDPESGKPHGGHALWNVVQALDQPENRDDRLPTIVRSRPPTPCPSDPSPPPVPVTFDVVEAERRMRNGKIVTVVVEGAGSARSGTRMRHGYDYVFEFGLSDGRWGVSSFPYGYESARFTEES